jgi:hypothetical protein
MIGRDDVVKRRAIDAGECASRDQDAVHRERTVDGSGDAGEDGRGAGGRGEFVPVRRGLARADWSFGPARGVVCIRGVSFDVVKRVAPRVA